MKEKQYRVKMPDVSPPMRPFDLPSKRTYPIDKSFALSGLPLKIRYPKEIE